MTDPTGSWLRWVARWSAGFAFALGVWWLIDRLVDQVLGPVYSHQSHVVRAVLTSAVVVPAFVALCRAEGASSRRYGVDRRRGSIRLVGLGVAAYLAPAIMAGAIIVGVGWASIDASVSVGVLRDAVAVLVLVLLFEAVPEELVFRGYLYGTLRERLPGWLTIIAQALLFCVWGFLLGAGTTLDRQILFAAFSVTLGVLRQLTGSVLVAIGFHAAFQWMSQWLQGEQWPSLRLHDPGFWLTPLALVLAPFLLAPVLVAIVVRRTSIISTSAEQQGPQPA